MQMLEAWGGVNGSLPRRLDARERGWGNSAAEGKNVFHSNLLYIRKKLGLHCKKWVNN